MPGSYEIGPFRLDTGAEILYRGAEPVAVGQRAVALLRVLVEQGGVPVAKDALIEAAWPGLAVEESNLTVQIAALRRVLAQEPGGNRWIETLPRRGYRFVGPIEATSDEQVITTMQAASLMSLPDKTEFVGRQREIGELVAALDDVLSGSGRLMMLVGEPGIGKTRTALELATHAGLQHVEFLWGRCYEGAGAPPYWPWVQAIRSHVRGQDADTIQLEMGSGAADIAEIIPDVAVCSSLLAGSGTMHFSSIFN